MIFSCFPLRYRPARLDLHESGTYHWIGLEKDTNRYIFLIFSISLLNIWKDFKVLSRFIQKWIQPPADDTTLMQIQYGRTVPLKVHKIEIFLASILKFVIFLCYLCQNINILQKQFFRFFRVVLRVRGMKKNFGLGQKNIFGFFIYEPFIWANNSFSKIRSIN